MKKDITTKEALEAITEDIAIYLLGLQIDNVEFVDKELLRIEKREADIVATCLINNSPSIIHLEIQNDNDKDMAHRMLRYRLDIMKAYSNTQIHQYVVYIGKDKLTMQSSIMCDNLNYNYTIVDMQNIDCESLIKLGDSLELAIKTVVENRSNETDYDFYYNAYCL